MVLNEEEKCVKITIPPEDNYELESEPYLSPRRAKAREMAISRGFINEIHQENWRWFNALSNPQYEGYSVDILNMLEGGNTE